MHMSFVEKSKAFRLNERKVIIKQSTSKINTKIGSPSLSPKNSSSYPSIKI